MNYEVDFIDQIGHLFVVNKCSLSGLVGLFTGITYHHEKPVDTNLRRELNDFYKGGDKTEISFTEQEAIHNKNLYLHLMRFPPISEYFIRQGK